MNKEMLSIETLLPQFKSSNSVPVTRATVSRKELEEIVSKVFDSTLEVVAETLESYHLKFGELDARKPMHKLHGEIYAKEIRNQKRESENE